MREARRQEDPGWEERHPFVFEVRKENGSLGGVYHSREKMIFWLLESEIELYCSLVTGARTFHYRILNPVYYGKFKLSF